MLLLLLCPANVPDKHPPEKHWNWIFASWTDQLEINMHLWFMDKPLQDNSSFIFTQSNGPESNIVIWEAHGTLDNSISQKVADQTEEQWTYNFSKLTKFG